MDHKLIITYPFSHAFDLRTPLVETLVVHDDPSRNKFVEMVVNMNHEELTLVVQILVWEQLNSVENEQSYLFDVMILKSAHISAYK